MYDAEQPQTYHNASVGLVPWQTCGAVAWHQPYLIGWEPGPGAFTEGLEVQYSVLLIEKVKEDKNSTQLCKPITNSHMLITTHMSHQVFDHTSGLCQTYRRLQCLISDVSAGHQVTKQL